MTLLGTLRSINATANRIERDSKRRQKEFDKHQKQIDKLEAIEQAEYEVEEYENYIDLIKSVHLDCGEHYNWEAVANIKPPSKPKNNNIKRNIAQKKFDNYKAGFFDKLFKQVDKKIEKLKNNIKTEIQNDEIEYKKSLLEFDKKLAQWEEETKLANDVCNFKDNIYEKIINEVNPFSEISEIGSKLSFDVKSKDLIQVDLHVNGEEIIPEDKKAQLASGKLSIKKMPKGEFYELYQDYVCSCTLRIANELFHLLPISTVNISALTEMLNTETGHLEDTPILSVLIHRRTFEKLNLVNIDPSDSMKNFIHNMDFKQTKGMQKVEKIVSNEFPAKSTA